MAIEFAYCFGCKMKQEMAEKERTMQPISGKKPQPCLRGKCAVCGMKMFKMLPVSKEKPV